MRQAGTHQSQPGMMVTQVFSTLVTWGAASRRGLRVFVAQQRRRVGSALLLALFLLSSTLGFFVQNGGVAMAAPVHRGPQPGTSARPTNTLASANLADHGKVAKTLPGQAIIQTSQPKPSAGNTIQRPTGITMRPLLIPLSVGASAHGLGSDGLLEVAVPVGAVTAKAVAAAQTQAKAEHARGMQKTVTPGGAPFAVQVTEVAGPSGGSDSGRVSLGTYLFTLVDVYGQRVPTTLAQPLNVTLHLPKQWRGAGFDLGHMQFVVDGSIPTSALPLVNGRPLSLGRPQVEFVTLDATGGLHTHLPLSSTGGSSSGSWNTDSPSAHWQAQTDTGVDLSSGDLTYSYPLDAPPGPGGLTPNLTLSYSSGNVTSNHNLQAASGWLGEGWDLSLGSISWSEHNVTATCTYDTCPQVCTIQNFYTCTTFENSWQFSDPYGNGGEIIPQDNNISTWYDDTSNPAPTVGSDQWFLNDNSQVKIFSYTNPNQAPYFPSGSLQPPCFRAFLPNGYMEEFGCTPDSLGFYVDDDAVSGYSGGNFPNQWYLDMIVDPNGNQIHISYNRYENYDKGNGAIKFPIDTVLGTVTYDSPGCHSTTTMCTGSSWQPQVQIVFNSAISAARLTGAACPTFTNTTTYLNSQTMRCDDVQDLSQGGTVKDLPAPTLQALAILNDVQVQVSTSGSSPSWQTLRDYQFSYDQAPSTNASNSPYDPVTGELESVAGYLDLTKIQEVGDDGTTTLPPLTMTYQNETTYYIDNYYPAAPAGNCGPAWNTGQGQGCRLWSGVTGRYLASMSNGQGWTETYTYNLARSNTHGVDTGLVANNPFSCTNATQTQQAATPCNEVDDQNWSRVVITNRTASVLCVLLNGNGCGPKGSTTLSSSSSYQYFVAAVTAKECSDCDYSLYWGNQNDGDKLDFYNTHFMGFYITDVTNPDGSLTVYHFSPTVGYGVATSSITCYSGNGCAVDPWTNPHNALHGHVTEEQDYDTNGTTLLKQTSYTYDVTCPPNGIGGSPSNTNPAGEYVGQRTSELDINNPVVYCEIRPATTTVSQVDGGSVTGSPTTTTTDTYTYDGHDHLTEVSQNVAASNAAATPNVVSNTWEAWDDALTILSESATGYYFIEQPAVQDTEDGSGNVKACTYTGYDNGTVGAEGSVSTLTRGLVSETTSYATNCTPGSLSGPVSTKRIYNSNGDLLATQDADAVAGVSGHTTSSCTYSSVTYTACASYDSPYGAQVTAVTNDLAQRSILNYENTQTSGTTPAAGNGWAQWLTGMYDANGQKTYYEYDPLGRLVAIVKPGYTDGWSSPTTSYAYPITCAATGAQEPCAALTTTQRLSGSDTVTSATYYDGWGRAVETVTPSSVTGTTCTVSVSYTEYDASGRKAFVSDPYFQTIANDASCAPSYFRPDSTQPGTTTTYDGLGRTLTTTDALSNLTTTTYTQGAPTGGANISDSATYEATTVVDANSHQTRTLVDGLGHTRYTEQFTGTKSSGFALEGTTQQNYDWLGNATSVYEPNVGSGGAGLSTTAQTTTTYNLISRATTTTDADLGTQTATYDPNGNVTETVDARGGSGGTVYAGYDGLNRQLWRNITNSPTGAYVTETYDQTTGHGDGIGRLTTEAFTNGAGGSSVSLSGSHSYTYDARGQVTGQTDSVSGVGAYSFSMQYNDAGQPTSLTYSDGEMLGTGYNAQGWLNQAQTTPSGGSAVTLATTIGYTGAAGAAMQPTSASIANGTYTYSASFDADLRLVTDSLTDGSTTAYSSTRGYDAVGNVISEDTTLTAGTDNQVFCYNEQNQLVWAGSTGASACALGVVSGTLTTAYYTQSYGYDAQGRLTSGAIGAYTYGDSNHPHGVTSIGGGTYTASYDAAGDLTCRAPNSSVTCTGTPTGATMSYDAERRLAHWQNTPASPTVQDDYLYDGAGARVEQYVQSSGPISTTSYLLGGVEEVSNGVVTKYLGAKGLPIAVRVGTAGSLNYLATDGLGSMSVAVDGSGNVVASQLYGPYGASRYSSGTMPTSKGFTGQRADATTGLDYYGARYYDPQAGQFTSADSVMQGLSRYAYVGGNPETATDPSGHLRVCGSCNGGGPGSGNGSGCQGDCGSGSNPCTSNCGSGTKIPPCNAACLAKGQDWINAVTGFISWAAGGSLKDDIKDFIKYLLPFGSAFMAVLGGDWMALIPLASDLTHLLRDLTDVITNMTNLFGFLLPPSFQKYQKMLQNISAFLDFITPVVDILGAIGGAFFNPLGAFTSKLSDYWAPMFEDAFGGKSDGSIIMNVITSVMGSSGEWLVNGTANVIGANVSPEAFCTNQYTWQLCH